MSASGAAIFNDQITIGSGSNLVNAGNMTLDVGGDLTIDADGGDIKISDGGTQYGLIANSNTDLIVQSTVSDKDIIFRGNDGGSTVVAMTLDMSDAGTAVFNHDVKLGSSGRIGIGIAPAEMIDIQSASGDARIRLDAPSGSDTEIKFFNDGSAQYTVGHDDATDNFVIGGANVDTPLFSINKSGAPTINSAYTLPTSDGTNGQVLKTNGSGTLSFADDSDATALLVIGRSANTSVTVTTGNLTVVGRSANVSVGVS